MTFLSKFTIGEVQYPSQMCYVNGNLVMYGVNPETIRVYYEETGIILNEWNSCHIFPCLMAFQIDGKEYLLVGCMYCKVICGYQSPETTSSNNTLLHLYKDIVPSVMCQGPNNTVLVFEEENSIKQLRFSEGHFDLARAFRISVQNIMNMCYCEESGIVVMVHNDRKTLTGVALASGEVVWKHTEIQFGSPAEVLNGFKDVFTIPDGRICIINLRELLVLDSKDGSIKDKLFHLEGTECIWSIAICNNGFHQRFAFHHGGLDQTQISLCKFTFFSGRRLPLQNIISDDENLQTLADIYTEI